MIVRSVIFTYAPLLKAYRYRDLFQLVPILYSTHAPLSKYAKHFPAFLEIKVDKCEGEKLACEDVLKDKGFSEKEIDYFKEVPEQSRVKREILRLLSVFTNFLFFEYSSLRGCWGIMTPFQDFDKLDAKAIELYNNQTSSWFINAYVYPGLKNDLAIEKFTDCTDFYMATEYEPRDYFTKNPNIENNCKVKIPPFMDFILDRYFSLDKDLRYKVIQNVGLLNDGIELFDNKRSVSLLSIISSVEGMALIDYKMYGRTPNLGAKNRVLRYLRIYVAGKSEDKFKKFYEKRCNITHEGVLFLGDIDAFGDINEQHKDWLFRMEILQAARLALYNWMRRTI